MSAFDPNIDANSLKLRKLLAQIAIRKIEGLRLYNPIPKVAEFHASSVPERLLRGSNRAGKTLGTMAEVARAVTNQDPHGKYPSSGVCYCVGKQGREVAQVLYAKLFKPGAYRIIRDAQTRKWRAFHPEKDTGREKEAKPSLPLIPKRLVKSIAWLDKKLNLPSLITLKTGWEIHFYSSEGEPTQGSAVDIVLFDEEIMRDDWYSEMSARLIDRSGKFIWGATPQAGTERLYSLSERAREQMDQGVQPRTIEEYFVTMEGNPYIGKAEKILFAQKFAEDEETTAVRIKGEFAILSGRVFPEYVPRLMEIDPFEIPHEWTRYVAIDPGRQVCAGLFLAVPPPDKGDFAYLYDELYIKSATAVLFGREMGLKSSSQTFHEFIVDMNEAQKHDTGYGKKILDQYSEQLEANKCKSTVTGHSFMAGNDNVKAGLEAIRFWLRMRPDGSIKLRVFRTLKNFIWEMKHYRNQRIKNEFIDKPEKKNDHTVDCLRYLAQRGPTWVPPPAKQANHSAAYRWWMKNKKKSSGEGILLGAGGYDAK